MADRIKLDAKVLQDLANDCLQLAQDLRDVGCRSHAFDDAPPVEDAFSDFEQRWDQTRTEVGSHVDVVVRAMTTIIDEFSRADEQLATSLDDGGQ